MNTKTLTRPLEKVPWFAIFCVLGVVAIFGLVWTITAVEQPVQVLEVEGDGIRSVEGVDYTGDGLAGGLGVRVEVGEGVEYINLISDHGVLEDRQRVYTGSNWVVVGSSEMDVGERWAVVAVGSDGEAVGVVEINHELQWPWNRPIIGGT